MSVAFYVDEHFPHAITRALRQRGVDVLTVQEDGRRKTDDPLLLDRATELGRVMVSLDKHFLQGAARRQSLLISFSGLIVGRKKHLPAQMSEWINALELIGIAGKPEDYRNQVKVLPYPF